MSPAAKKAAATKKAAKKAASPTETETEEAPAFPPIEETKEPDLETKDGDEKALAKRRSRPPRPPYFKV